MSTEIFTRNPFNNSGDLAAWFTEVEAGNEYAPFCNLCDELIISRDDALEIFFKNDFEESETIQDNQDYGLAAHKSCVTSGLAKGRFTALEEW